MKDKDMVPQDNRRTLTPLADLWSPFEGLHRQMDRLFDDFTRGWGLAPVRTTGRGWADLTPRVDVAETDKDIRVTAELPGMDEKDIEVNLTGDVLVLKGEKKAEVEEKDKNFHRVERTFGAFERAIGLPVEVDPAKVEARFRKGVLTVTLAKTPAAQSHARKIEVKPE
jgi:HSP20 family protein